MPRGAGWTQIDNDHDFKEEFHMRKMYCDEHLGGVWMQHEPNEDQEICWSCWMEDEGKNASFADVNLREIFADWLESSDESLSAVEKKRKRLQRGRNGAAAAQAETIDVTADSEESDHSSGDSQATQRASHSRRSPNAEKKEEKDDYETDLDASSVSDVDYSDSGRDTDYETGSEFEPTHVFRKGQRLRHNNRTMRVRKIKRYQDAEGAKEKLSLGTRYSDYEVPMTERSTLKKAIRKGARSERQRARSKLSLHRKHRPERSPHEGGRKSTNTNRKSRRQNKKQSKSKPLSFWPFTK